MEQLVADLNPRLLALASAHDSLMSDNDNADLKQLIVRLLQPYFLTGSDVDAEGQPVSLHYQHVTPLCLILHELATNSAKYGAIRSRAGVSIRWTRSPSNLLDLDWTEDVADRAELTGGFGTKLIQIATRQLNGTITTDWVAGRLRVKLSFPL